MIFVPKEPARKVLEIMALKYRSDFNTEPDDTSPMACGLNEVEREHVLQKMEALYEAIVLYYSGVTK